MLNRRSFLTSTLVALGQLLSGCSNSQAALRVLLLQSSIPPQLLSRFRKLRSKREFTFKPKAQLQDIYTLLQSWQEREDQSNRLPLLGQALSANLVTIGDYWLADAIRKQLIQPLDTQSFEQWKLLPPRWQELVQRNSQGYIDPDGSVWAAPYRWGSTLIAYRRDKFKDLGWTPSDWSDLWREELKDRISLLNQPREVIGLTLKKLGYSYNTENLDQVPNLKAELLKLQQQVKFYSSDNYLQPLILGDTWLAVGWSTDILPLQKRYSKIQAVVPQPGTSLWTDVWVQPRSASDSLNPETEAALINQWINFCWLPQSANQISLFTSAASPVALSLEKEDLAEDLQNNLLVLMQGDLLDNSDFLLPLPPSAQKQYQALWREVRASVGG